MRELMETRFFKLLAGESLEGVTKEELGEESEKFAGEVASLCDSGEEYLFTCRTLYYTKNRLLVLRDMCQASDGAGEKGEDAVVFYQGGIKSG